MRHYKFVGGPWDGEYHDVDGRQYLNVGYPSIIEKQLAEIVEDAEFEPMKICRYSLREFTVANGQNKITFYADSQWSDLYTFSQLIHHYKGRP